MARGHYETKEADGGMMVYLSFSHEECVERIKEEIPSQHRRWDGDEKAWWFSNEYIDEAEEIVSEFFDEG